MKALVVLSGGQDSSTCLALALAGAYFNEVHAITFDYGQRHRAEIEAARNMISTVHRLVASWELIQLPPGVLAGTSPLVNPEASVERYTDAASLPRGLEKTFVPMRNALFLTVAANRAVAISGGEEVHIYTGVSQEDYGGYPDCREEFIVAQEFAIQKALDDPELPRIAICTPLMYRSKAETVAIAESLAHGRALNALSHTCYNGEVPPCGKCHACLLREKGYAIAGVRDPLLERLEMEASHA